MGNYMLIRHKVRDFSEWKIGYDAHLSKREEAGLSEKYLLRGTDDPNEVVILTEAVDITRAAPEETRSAPLGQTLVSLGRRK
ncbi:MAG: hypothetical protein M3X11_25285 [Acidobacteriota bacterium]|nr:hypothetical protein [Acidobacteriota bacterium]